MLLTGSVAAQERHLRTYTLQHASAEQVMPALSAQLSPDSSVTSYRQQLILNVTDTEYQTVQTLLAQLDTAPHSLLISVRKQNQQSHSDTRIGIQGTIEHGSIQVQSGNSRDRRLQNRVIVNRSDSQNNRDGSQQVRAIEGRQAFISAGSTVSMRSGNDGQRELVPVESGFYATARIVGDEVVVDIDQHDDHMQGRNMDTQSLQTQVRGRIGEWIPLGGLNTSQSDNERGLTRSGNHATGSAADLAIKIDLLDR